MKETEVKKVVRERYGNIAKNSGSCCSSNKSCCSGTSAAEAVSKNIGYSDEDIKAVPEGANLGLGCGNPVALASLQEGETVLDLGSGAGFDCFLASAKVGKQGKVIGVDMTPEMLEKARNNAEKGGYSNVEFRLGEIENLPVADGTVNAIISNCVINLSPDKRRVFKEAYRVLQPGGRLMVSDIVLLKEIPEAIRNSIEAYVSCIGGAETKEKYLSAIADAGFTEVEILDETGFPAEFITSEPDVQDMIKKMGLSARAVGEIAGSVVSVKVCGFKPE